MRGPRSGLRAGGDVAQVRRPVVPAVEDCPAPIFEAMCNGALSSTGRVSTAGASRVDQQQPWFTGDALPGGYQPTGFWFIDDFVSQFGKAQ